VKSRLQLEIVTADYAPIEQLILNQSLSLGFGTYTLLTGGLSVRSRTGGASRVWAQRPRASRVPFRDPFVIR